jgi:hypothetical protein
MHLNIVQMYTFRMQYSIILANKYEEIKFTNT